MGHCRVTVKHVWKVDREDEVTLILLGEILTKFI